MCLKVTYCLECMCIFEILVCLTFRELKHKVNIYHPTMQAVMCSVQELDIKTLHTKFNIIVSSGQYLHSTKLKIDVGT